MQGPAWQVGREVTIAIADFNERGDGVGRTDGLAVFVPGGVPGDRLVVRLVQVKKNYAIAQIQKILESSSDRVRPSCIVADKCGGCQWQHVRYKAQLAAKQRQVTEALKRVGGFADPPVLPALPSEPFRYRNKVTYPVGTTPDGRLKAGYYRKGSHRLINLNQCPIQDDRLDRFLAEIKIDMGERGWPAYDERQHAGEIRHVSLRVGRRTGEVLLAIVSRSAELPGLEAMAQEWLQRYTHLVGVCLNVNSQRGNTIFGSETRCVAGRDFLYETFAGLNFCLRSDTFFQVNTEAAESLLQDMAERLELKNTDFLVDAYCGIGTFALPLAKRVRSAIGIEIQESAVERARHNAALNGIENVEFQTGRVENLLPLLAEKPDVVLLDPPRKGCDRAVLETLIQARPDRIAYISCKPSTLARDLKILCETGDCKLQAVRLADFFPQTTHVECAAFLKWS